jgi:hypothetical protein
MTKKARVLGEGKFKVTGVHDGMAIRKLMNNDPGSGWAEIE